MWKENGGFVNIWETYFNDVETPAWIHKMQSNSITNKLIMEKVANRKEYKTDDKIIQSLEFYDNMFFDEICQHLTVENFQTYLDDIKKLFPDSKFQWLIKTADLFNEKLPFKCDPVFENKFTGYPSSILQPALKCAIMGHLEECGITNVAYLYHYLLNIMCEKLCVRKPVFGYKMLLQIIGQNWPYICCQDMANVAMLRNFYQHDIEVCLSILWVVGQGGHKNVWVGLKVFQNLMRPVLEFTDYCKFVTSYIYGILGQSEGQSLNVTTAEAIAMFNSIQNNQPKQLRKKYKATLSKCSRKYLELCLKSGCNAEDVFTALFTQISNATTNQVEIYGCILCLLHNGNCFVIWFMQCTTNVFGTNYIIKEIKKMTAEDQTLFKTNLDWFESIEKKTSAFLYTNIAKTKYYSKVSVNQKKQNAETKKKCGCCRWLVGCLVVSALIAAALIYDTNANGKGVFAKSASGKFLQNAGLLPVVESSWYKTMSACARGYKWAEENVPPYAKPLGSLICDMYKITRNLLCESFSTSKEFLNSKLPVVGSFLDQYFPGTSVKIEDCYITVKTFGINTFSSVSDYLSTQIFIGRYSPENISKALNETHQIALGYYAEFYKKVNAYAKLK